VFCKFNTVWELPNPEKKKKNPDTSSYLSGEAEGPDSSRYEKQETRPCQCS
jgi:hypothetical protein